MQPLDPKIVLPLLDWYACHGRKLPWRRDQDPYRIWVSEIMLQQTRVETVLNYYDRFLESFPTLEALAGAPEEKVMLAWQGLGYYRRAKGLQEGARQVMQEFHGRIPRTRKELMSLHGVGSYTAGAIASIAFQKREAAVDGNAVRVFSRLACFEHCLEGAYRKELEKAIEDIIPEDHPGQFNQAVMDLGSMVCTPVHPRCSECPLQGMCLGKQNGTAQNLPRLPEKKSKTLEEYAVLLIFHQNTVLLEKKTDGLLKGLWLFPMVPGHYTENEISSYYYDHTLESPRGLLCCGHTRHIFTHRIWEMTFFTLESHLGGRLFPGACPMTADMLEEHAIPSAMALGVREAQQYLRRWNGSRENAILYI